MNLIKHFLCILTLIFSFHFLLDLPFSWSTLCAQLCLPLCLHQYVTSNLLFALTLSLLAISEEDIHYSKS